MGCDEFAICVCEEIEVSSQIIELDLKLSILAGLIMLNVKLLENSNCFVNAILKLQIVNVDHLVSESDLLFLTHSLQERIVSLT